MNDAGTSRSESAPVRRRSPPLRLMMLRLIAALVWLAIWSAGLSTIPRAPSWPFVFGKLILASAAVFLLFLALLIDIAAADRAGKLRFGLRALFLLTALVGVVAGLLRSILPAPTAISGVPWQFVALFITAVLLCSAGPVLWFGEALLWLAVWLVRRPIVQGWLKRRRAGRTHA